MELTFGQCLPSHTPQERGEIYRIGDVVGRDQPLQRVSARSTDALTAAGADVLRYYQQQQTEYAALERAIQ